MNIQLNGKEHAMNESLSVEQLLASLGLAGKPVIVEHNKEALFPRDYKDIMIKDGDSLEIITVAAGG